jgi:hypothetical protein
LLCPLVTSLTAARLSALPMTLLAGTDPELETLGVSVTGTGDLAVIVTDPSRRIGHLQVEVLGTGNVLFFDNREATGTGRLHGNIRMLGSDCTILFDRLGDSYIALHDMFLRSNGQTVFWGAGATAVGCSVEWEGDGRSLVIGEDCLLSSGIWIRNHDMHAIHDIQSGERITRQPVDTIVERHVWIGQNAMLHSCERIGMGSIVGAMSLVKGAVGACVAVAGAPARVVRHDVSWGRDLAGMTERERVLLGLAQLAD